jgi:CMP-N,N'-diacetyllegionaminic acid synthase
MDKVLCTVCARGGSKGVLNKNIRKIAGKPLIAHTIEKAKQSNLFEYVVISTDSIEIAEIAKAYGAEHFFERPAELASDTSAKLPVIQHAFLKSEAHYNCKFDILLDLDATSPLRSVEDLIKSLETFKNGNFDNLITGAPARRSPYFNLVEVSETEGVVLSKNLENPIVRRQDAPKCYDMNASIYIWKRDALLSKNSLFGGNTGLYVMPEERSIDIDSELDFYMVEYLLKKKEHRA